MDTRSGHYLAYNFINNNFIKCDDEQISLASYSNAVRDIGENGYLYFFARARLTATGDSVTRKENSSVLRRRLPGELPPVVVTIANVEDSYEIKFDLEWEKINEKLLGEIIYILTTTAQLTYEKSQTDCTYLRHCLFIKGCNEDTKTYLKDSAAVDEVTLNNLRPYLFFKFCRRTIRKRLNGKHELSRFTSPVPIHNSTIIGPQTELGHIFIKKD